MNVPLVSGIGVISSVFVALTAFAVRDIGWKETALIWGFVLAVLAVVSLGSWLLVWGLMA